MSGVKAHGPVSSPGKKIKMEVTKMKLYEIFISEGGVRVAGKIVNGSPVISESPWFASRVHAKKYADKMKSQHPAFKKVNGKWECTVDFFVSS